MKHIKEQLNWTSKTELKQEVLQGIKEIGSILYWMGLLDIVLVSFMAVYFVFKIKANSITTKVSTIQNIQHSLN